MENVKIGFTTKTKEGGIIVEWLWAKPTGEYFEIDNVPFYTDNIALGDIVSVEIDGDELYFDEIIKSSGRSVIHLVFFQETVKDYLLNILIDYGCSWEQSDKKNLYSIDVPDQNIFNTIKRILDEHLYNSTIDYKESCLGWL